MPTLGLIKNSENQARKTIEKANIILDAIHELEQIQFARNSGRVDFAAIDFTNSLEFGAYDDSVLNKAIDDTISLFMGGSLDRLREIVNKQN